MTEIEETLLALESELGVMLTVHDVGGVFHDATGGPLLPPSRQTHRRNPLCVAHDRGRCMEHCNCAVNARCLTEGDAYFTSRCWTGVVELVVPLRRGRAHLGTLAAGAWREGGQEGIPPCYAKAETLSEAFLRLEPLPPDRAERLGRVLATAGDGLMAKVERLQQLEAEPGDRRGEIFRFVSTNATRRISTGDLAERLHLSCSRAGHLVAELFGVPFAELLQQERLKRAKTLLLSTDFRVKEIAARSGFGDEFHFSRSFRKAVGVSPGRYRRGDYVKEVLK